jgi:hypothetical protein
VTVIANCCEDNVYTRQGVKLKDYEFSLSLITDAYERDIPLQEVVKERLKAVGEWLKDSHFA